LQAAPTPPDDTCPAGLSAVTLTEGADAFSSTTPAQCILALGGDDTLAISGSGSVVLCGEGDDTVMAGPGAVVRGDNGDDTINVWGGSTGVYGNAGDDTIQAADGNNFVVPGPGKDAVTCGAGDDTVAIFDVCEIQKGESLNGGKGSNTLISPISAAALKGLGVTVRNFQTVAVQQNSCKSDCVPKPNCSSHGSCAEGSAPGLVRCQCDLGFADADCSRVVPPILPVLVCVSRVDDTHFDALFGYDNKAGPAKLQVGEDNGFSPGAAGRGQVVEFNAGSVAAAFGVRFDGTPLTWTLAGQTVTASADSPQCVAPACPGGCAEGAQCVGTQCTSDCGDGLCAGDENCDTCAADCACSTGQVCFAGTCATRAKCGVDWQCGAGTSFGVSVDCGACSGNQTCVNHRCQ
jgi:Ca2+-binding RTX toxin-like protein